MRWNPEYLLRVIAGEYVLVAVSGEAAKSSQIIAINQTAGEICELVIQGLQDEEIVQTLLQRYEIDRLSLQEDVACTLQQLQQLNAICL